MAWPLNRLTTYVANTLPAIKAFDLNSIQDTIISLWGAASPTIMGVIQSTLGTQAAEIASQEGRIDGHQATVAKTWAVITFDNSGAAIVAQDGLGLTISATFSNAFQVTISPAMDNADYAIIGSCSGGGGLPAYLFAAVALSSSQFEVLPLTVAVGGATRAFDKSTDSTRIFLAIHGNYP